MFGIKVVIDTKLPINISGRCVYNENIILLNEFTAKDAFETLSHETGHWLLYKKIGFIPQILIPIWFRELYANYIMKILIKKYSNK